jgi:hypothetical protein
MPSPQFSASTWRVLGISVASGYTVLGSFAIFSPVNAAKVLGVWPKTVPEDGNSPTANLMILLGARDLSIATALWVFEYQRKEKSMATVILSGMILCALDTWMVFKTRGVKWGSLMGAGAALWGAIGLGLSL